MIGRGRSGLDKEDVGSPDILVEPYEALVIREGSNQGIPQGHIEVCAYFIGEREVRVATEDFQARSVFHGHELLVTRLFRKPIEQFW